MNLLHIGLYSAKEPQQALRLALRNASDSYKEIDWSSMIQSLGKSALNGYMLDTRQDTIFMQIQAQNIIDVETVKALSKRGVKIFNFTGDVRQPLPDWYKELAPYVTSLFTNENDAIFLKELGYNAHYFQIGYDETIYCPEGEKGEYEIVFMGNNYKNMFPLSALRELMVEHLQKRYGKRFQVFGTGWKDGVSLMFKQKEEAKVYRGAKCAINLSHFNLKRYSSDRMFRIMGCGAPCLSHHYPDIEKEFNRGEHLVTWTNFHELDALIDECLNTDYRKNIGAEGQKRVSKYFTWEYRIQNQFLNYVD